jgi:hypothetical protein
MEAQFREIKECLVASDLKNSAMFSHVNCELDKINEKLEMEYSAGMLPIDEEDLNIIYECFILPYIKCEVERMGTINQIIDINKILVGLIETTEHPKTKLILLILKDIMQAMINARNEYMSHSLTVNRLEHLQQKYNKCSNLIMQLEAKIDSLQGTAVAGMKFSGKLGIVAWKPPSFILIQAKFNLDRAWYHFLYNTSKLDPDKYNSTMVYVRSFGSKRAAYLELVRLVEEREKSFMDDMKKIYEEK